MTNKECHPIFQAVRAGDEEQVRKILADDSGAANALEGRMHVLRLAILCGYEDIAELLIEIGADVDPSGPEEPGPLADAVSVRSLRLVRLLLDRGADPNAPKGIPLLSAAWDGQKEIAEALLDHGADVDVCDEYTKDTALDTAVEHYDIEFARLLIERGADVNAQCARGWSPLHTAAGNSHAEMVRLLIHSGANPALLNDKGYSPLMAASCADPVGLVLRDSEGGWTYLLYADATHPKIGDVHVGRTIEAVFDPWADGEEVIALLVEWLGRDRLSIHEAASINDIERVSDLLLADPALVDCQLAGIGTPLHSAAGHGHLAIADLLLSCGADVDSRVDGDGDTPLHAAVEAGQAEMAHFLIAHGADVSARDRCDATLLHKSTHKTELVKLFLERGISVDERDSDKATALHYAAMSGNAESTSLLIEAGADVNARGFYGETPLQQADSSEIVQLLMSAGANPLTKNDSGETPLLSAIQAADQDKTRLLLQACKPSLFEIAALGALDMLKDRLDADPSLLYALDTERLNRSLLHYAAEMNRPAVAEYLLDMGINPNVQDDKGDTALHLAAESEGSAVGLLLISRGADVSAVNNHGYTPLVEAAYHLNYDLAEALIANGADVNARNDEGNTPLEQSESRRMSQLLYRHGAVL